jgi:hypothetical protein
MSTTRSVDLNGRRNVIKRIVLVAALLVVLGRGSNNVAVAQGGQQPSETSTAAPPEAEHSVTVLTVRGKIVEIDRVKMLMTIEGTEERRIALRVANPHNLDAAKVGDIVVTRYYEVVKIRKKRPNEIVPSTSLREGIVTAKPGGAPGSVAERQASLLVSVMEVDEGNGIITLKAPDGTVEVVRAANPKNLKQLKAGDELVVTLEHATAISLQKEPAS